ncbi:Natural cytotoxicity triggering receptor 3 ligand 1 [Plecturocebus cupreus]
MGATLIKAKLPLKCILDNWDQFDTQSLKKWFSFLCQIAWPPYPLLSAETWPPKGSKWIEVPYVQVFFSLRDHPQLCKACNLCPTGPSSGLPPYSRLPMAPPSTDADQVSSAPITQRESGKAETAKAPQATRMPQLFGGEFGPFISLSDLKQINVDLGKFSDDLDKYIDVLQGLDQSFKLDWKDIRLLLSQTLTNNEREAALTAA